MDYSVLDHIKLSRVSSVAASPDGEWLAVSAERLDREGGQYLSDIWKVPTDGGEATQLTRGETRDTAPGFRHDGSLAFLSNRRPNELEADDAGDDDKRMQVWILPVAGGEPRQLTDEPLGVESFKFARRADRLVLMAPVIEDLPHEKQREAARERLKNGPSGRRFRRQPVRHWDRWLHESADLAHTHVIACSGDGGNRVDLTPEARGEFAIDPDLDVSGDGRSVAVTRQTPGADRELDTTVLVIDLESGQKRVLGTGTNVNNEQPRLSIDGRKLAVVRSTRSADSIGCPVVTLIDTVSGEETALARDWDRWPALYGWTSDGTALLLTADDAGATPVYSIDAGTGRLERLTSLAARGAHSSLQPLADGRLVGIRSTLLEAPECFVVDVGKEAEPRSLARLSGLSGADWAAVESREVTSTDGTPVQYFFVKPAGGGAPFPTLVWIHGGPIAMSGDSWHWRWNPLLAVAKGYAVALPNPRGSTGFGQAFIQGIWGNVWGDQCYRDLMSVTDDLVKRDDVDADRVMAMGGSFGGYMTNWIGTQTDRFRCLITHASIFTMARFTGVTDHPAWWYLEMGGEDPYADPARFDRYAPVSQVKNWTTPTLIIHGERDYRCPIGEGLNLFEALQYHGVPSELLIFPDENHWVLKPRNVVAWYDAVFDFLARHMQTPRGDEVAPARRPPVTE